MMPFVAYAQIVKLDKKIGEESAIAVAKEMVIYEDVQKTQYVSDVGNRLISYLDKPLFDYKFQLVSELTPNAFALPGGYIYISTGLLAILNSEDELACILGHEIIHSNNRHTVKQIKGSILPKILEVPGDLIGVLHHDLGVIFNTPIQTSNALLFASYGREFEKAADHLGVELAAKSGYDPSAMLSVLNRLSLTIEIITGMKEEKSYFNDHPYTPDRKVAISKAISKIDFVKQAPVSSRFLMEFDMTLFGDDPSRGVIKKNKFVHPQLKYKIEFPKHWSIENQPTNVTAFSPDGQAALIVSLADSEKSPKELGLDFIASMDDKYKSKLAGSEPYSLKDREGYIIWLKDEDGPKTIGAYVLWLPLGDHMYQFLSIAPCSYEKKILSSVTSFKQMSTEDEKNITASYIKVIKAKEGETIGQLSKQSKNVLSQELTTVINDKKANDILLNNELIKVVKVYMYKYK